MPSPQIMTNLLSMISKPLWSTQWMPIELNNTKRNAFESLSAWDPKRGKKWKKNVLAPNRHIIGVNYVAYERSFFWILCYIFFLLLYLFIYLLCFGQVELSLEPSHPHSTLPPKPSFWALVMIGIIENQQKAKRSKETEKCQK